MINVDRLTKTFGLERAVDDISFEVERGEVLGFLGPNGAGKSTTMRVLTCYLPPSAGSVSINGLDVTTDSLAIRRLIGYLPESTPLYPDMTVRDYLRFVAAIRDMSPGDERTRIAYVVDVCGLTGVLSKRIETLSKGYRQRVGLAQAMLHDPEILILDEPTSGLDPNQIAEIRDLVKSLGQEKTVILSTHILPEVEASCDRVLIINRGKIVADGSPESLQARFQGDQRLLFGVEGDGAGVEDRLRSVGGLSVLDHSVDGESSMFTLVLTGTSDVRPDLYRLAVENGWVLTELHREEARLEDVFRQLTSGKAYSRAKA
ncbi:MAG TPA: ATP-binding cassette domain-containing protein [Rhodothermales bacterium]